ncbi:MAG: ABC transporter permease [Candidatus Hadarchaeum sp.]|uniref:ABC transporter permease n=1 Tax=Candidatus Hadarchaeum sp. TaxID=2883567 RepID=UPI003D0CC5DB
MKLKIQVQKSNLIMGLLNIAAIIGAVIGVVAISSVVSGVDLERSFSTFLTYTVGSHSGILYVLKRTTPLILASLGLAVAFKSGFWNIGAEGQIAIGAIASTGVCLFLGLPDLAAVALAFILSFVITGLYSAVSGYLKVKWDVNDIVVTMMMNFIALALFHYLISGPWFWKQAGAVGLYSRTAPIPEGMRFPFISQPLSSAFILAIAFVFIVYFLMKKTVLGYQLRVVGDNPTTALCQGINVKRVFVVGAIISGGLCGLAGMSLVLGEFFRMQAGITGNYGFFAIPIAIFCRNEPLLVPFGSFLVAIIIEGTLALTTLGMPSALSEVLLGVLFLVVFFPELVNWVRKRRKKA